MPHQTVQILQERAQRALSNGGWDNAIIERIASMAGGDARVAAAMGQVESGALWHSYLMRCLELSRQPIALKTSSEYMNRMADTGLIQIDRAPIKGNVRLFRVKH